MQDACIRAWLGFDALHEPASILPWLFRILRSVLTDEREKAVRREQIVQLSRLDDVCESEIAVADDTLESLVWRSSSDGVGLALRNLPEDFATAVELHDIQGLRYRDIAEIMGVPVGTVMSRISRGRKLLAGMLVSPSTDRATTRNPGNRATPPLSVDTSPAHEMHGDSRDA